MPYKKYIGRGIAADILLYMEQHADIKFKYPVDVSKVGMPREQQSTPESQG